MAAIPVTIRFSPETLALVSRAAGDSGVSLANFVRGAAAARALIILNEGAGREAHNAVLALLEHPEIERLARAR